MYLQSVHLDIILDGEPGMIFCSFVNDTNPIMVGSTRDVTEEETTAALAIGQSVRNTTVFV